MPISLNCSPNPDSRITFRNLSAYTNMTGIATKECALNPAATFEELAALWDRCHACPGLSENSRASALSVIRKHLLPAFGDIPVRSITTQMVLDYIHQQAREFGCYRKITPWVLRLQALLSKAVEWGLISENPVKRIDALFLGGKFDLIGEAFRTEDCTVTVSPVRRV